MGRKRKEKNIKLGGLEPDFDGIDLGNKAPDRIFRVAHV